MAVLLPHRCLAEEDDTTQISMCGMGELLSVYLRCYLVEGPGEDVD
jgi:hypothetical protein